MADKSFTAWMPELTIPVPATAATPIAVAEHELRTGLQKLGVTKPFALETDAALGEAFTVTEADGRYVVRGGETGVLYGAYALLHSLRAGVALPVGEQKPFYPLRMINCWDNAAGDIERGYAGRSLFYEADCIDYDPVRLRMLARMLASCGINVLCINNVNVHEPMQQMLEGWLPRLAEIAALFRPFGVRLMVSIDFSRPMKHGIPTADPLDERVQQWWNERAATVWAAVPDLAGFLVKADSEHRPGPFTYGRSHSEGANMLARAVAPFGGVVVWRCFVYNCGQDWRDQTTDRGRAAYDVYTHLDGEFDDNVILQIKYGPFDFQVREPISPLLLAMPKTSLALELQLAQEYTGQQIDIFYMPPMWREVFDDMGASRVCSIAAVSNLGRDDNYTGHPFAAANLFAYGLMAWNPAMDVEQITSLWCRLTYDLPEAQYEALTNLLMGSRDAYELYTGTLGLCWMITPNSHYGPNPDGYEFQAWGTYHRATCKAVGVDRTPKGTGMTDQYPEPLRSLYASPETCPEKLLLFFHRLPYSYRMADGRTLLQRIYDDHFEGYERVLQMQKTLAGIDLPEPDRTVAAGRMDRQVFNAKEWCDIVNTFFYRFTGIGDANGRTIYE